MSNPIIIQDWQKGVADSANVGFGMMKLVDIEMFPGSVKVKNKTATLFHTPTSNTFTAVAATDICTFAGTVPATGTAVTLTTTGTLPAGLSTGTTYFVIKLTSSTFKLATTVANANAGTAINITDAGTGTHTMTTTDPGSIKHIIRDKRSGFFFMQDSNGRVWFMESATGPAQLLLGNTLTNANGNGIALFLTSDGSATYLFAFRNASIDVVNVFGTSQVENPTWSNSWKSLNSGSGSGNSHHAILAQDNIIYFCDARYIGSIVENAGSVFDPASSGTYTYNNQALDTPQNEVLNWLTELGTKLLAAGGTFNNIYPWDRLSASYTLPIAVPEISIQRIINSGGLVYILAGTKGNIYTTQGSYCTFFRNIPQNLSNASGTPQAGVVTWGGIALRNGALIIGVGTQTSGTSGVYLVYPDGRLVIDQIPSSGSALVTALYAENDFYFLGYSGGADYSDPNNRYTNLEAVIQSQIYQVANKTLKGQYANVEIQLPRPTTGTVKMSWRPDNSSAFTELYTFTLDGSATSFQGDATGLTDIENIQIQFELSGNVELLNAKLLP